MATDKGSLICTTGVVAILGLAAMWSQPTSYISGADQSGKDGSPKDNKTKRLILKEKSKDPPARKFVGGMTARPRPVSAPAKSLTVGEEISTRGGERQRFLLPDASIIYVNESTKLKLNAERELSLSAGEIFLASCPIAEGQRSHPWIVRGGDREISALGAKLVVQSDAAGSRVVVVQGRASVNGFGEIPAGKQIALASNQVSGAPRISRLLGWIKEPMIAAEAPLVPSSKHAGGALIAVDPSGREQSLSLRKYRIDVHIEDGFARTTIDQTYFNHSPARLEGTFYFPLPADASLSRLAMYVDGTLMEGGMAERDYARQTFESIVAKQKDPALLEWVDGQTFKMRVFPLEGRQEKRIILSYTQRLPNLFDHAQYLFPSGHSLEMVGDWSFHALIKDGASLKWSCPTHALRGSKQGNDLIVEGQAHQVKLERDLVLNLIDTAESKRVVRFTSAEHETGRYLMLRYRPGLPGCSPPSPRDWVFLFESSADRDPPLARAQIEVIRHVLANANPEDTFAILTAGTRVQAMTDKPLPVTAENIRRGIEFLEHAHLIGALDLGRALTAAAKFLRAGKNPYLFQLGSAVPAMGERDTEELVRLIPTKACYIGVDVGKSWSRAFMKSAAERHNGYFTQINPTEPISWRTFELMSTLDLPRLMNVKVTDEGGKTIFLTGAPTLTQGEDLCAVAQFEAPPKEGRVKPWMPKAIKITGTLEGQPLERIIPVDQVTGGADYLPRFWTKLGIDRLLTEFNRAPQASPHEENKEAIKSKIIELSKAMYVMSPFTSLLVLENEEMYKQYQVDRGRKDHWAMYPLPAKIPVVREPANLDGRGVSDKAASVSGKPSAQQVLQSIEVRQPPPILAGGNSEMPPMYFEHLTAADAIAQNDWRPRYVDNSLHLMARRPGGLGFGGLGLGGLGGGGLGLGGGALGLGGLGLGLGIGGAGNGLGGFQGFGGGGMVGLGIGGGLGGLGFAGPIPLRPVGPTGGPISWRFWWEQPEDEDDDEDPAVRRKIPDRPHEFSSRDERERIRHMREKLAQVISVEFEPNIPLQEALNSLRDRYDLNFVLDVEAFRTDRNEPDIEHFPIKLPRMSNVRLGTVLSLMLSRVHGRIAIHADFIEVTTRRGVRTELEEDGFESYWGEIFARRNLLERWRHGLTYSGGMLSFEGGAPNVQLLPSTSWKVGRGEFNNESGGQPAQPSPATGGQNSMEHLIREIRSANTLGNEIDRAPAKWTFRNDWKDVDEFVARFLEGLPFNDRNWLYQRPKFSGDERVFTYLTAYAPGMNTSRADVLSTLEAEADADPSSLPGHIDCSTRRLIEKARKTSWQKVSIAEKNGQRSFAVVFDGIGRFAFSKVLENGLREQTICDGQHLWHLYPELGVAAQRAVSRFHRADLAILIPWVLPPVDDLARGADLERVDHLEVAIVPHSIQDQASTFKGQSRQIHLLFSPDGRLIERQMVEMPSKNVIYRETYDPDGLVQLMDCKGTVLAERQFHTAPAEEPALKPNAEDFLISHLPLRNHHYSETGKTDRHDLEERVPKASTLDLIAKQVSWRQMLKSATGDSAKGLLQRLLDLHALYENRDKVLSHPELEHVLAQIREGPKDAIGWAMLSLVQDRLSGSRIAAGALAEIYPLFVNYPGFSYEARYEHARCLLLSSRRQEARRILMEIYQQKLAKDGLPPIDWAFRRALLGDRQEADEWTPLIWQTAGQLAAAKRGTEIVMLAWQCWQIGDQTLSKRVLRRALEGVGASPEGRQSKLAAIEFLWQTRQLSMADKVLESLLADPEVAGRSSLWRLGARLALQRRQPARFAHYLEQALEVDCQNPPDMMSLEAVRTDFGLLLDHYQQLAAAHRFLNTSPPADLAARVVRFVDHWRRLDPDNPVPCVIAAQILYKLGEGDLTWDYMNTPAAILPFDSQAWWALADALRHQEDFTLAERAYEQAVDAEPDNVQILWERAQNLENAGNPAEARRIYQQIADRAWRPDFDWIKEESRLRCKP